MKNTATRGADILCTNLAAMTHIDEMQDPQFIVVALLNNLPNGVVMFGPEFEMIACNFKFRELLDLPEHLFSSSLPSLKTLINFNVDRGEYGAGVREEIFGAVFSRKTRGHSYVYERVRPNGIILRIRSNPLQGGGLVATFSDITCQRETERALQESEERFRGAFETAAIGMALVGLEGRWLKVNQALCEMIGYSEEELLAKTFQDITYHADLEIDLGRVKQLLAGTIPYYHMEKRYFHKKGHVIWVILSVSLVRNSLGEPIHFVSQIENVTDRKRSEELSFHMAHHDILTNLPNRRLMLDRLNQAMARARRFKHAMALLFLDLDHFKEINDTLGHNFGDELLKVVAVRLLSCVRNVDTVSRQGGDEFVIVLAEISQHDDAALVANKILNVFREPINIEGRDLHVSASIGVAIHSPSSVDDIDDLIHRADVAMYEAKQSGRNQWALSG